MNVENMNAINFALDFLQADAEAQALNPEIWNFYMFQKEMELEELLENAVRN